MSLEQLPSGKMVMETRVFYRKDTLISENDSIYLIRKLQGKPVKIIKNSKELEIVVFID